MTLIKLPTLSVVIPVRNEQDYLRGCLDSVLIALDRVPPAEVLIVEGRSTDETRDIALQYGADIETIRKALCRDRRGRPSGPLSAALDLIACGDYLAP